MYFFKEWEHFTRIVIGDLKADKKTNVPRYVDAERVGDFALLRANLPELYQKAGLDDESTWRRWCESNECERQFQLDTRLIILMPIQYLQ